MDLLDVDVLVFLIADENERDELRDNPLYAQLDVATQGRIVFLNYRTDPLGVAVANYYTVLSLPFIIDRLVPKLAAAVDGDPATPVPS